MRKWTKTIGLLAVLLTILSLACDRPVTETAALSPAPPPTPQFSTSALRVCADPNNLPFSNESGDGFENKIANVIAEELELPLEYTWWAQRRGFVRNTLRAGKCDVVMGVPNSFELALASKPYYRSTYVFVVRRDSGLDIRSFDDEKLQDLRIGVHLIGDDNANAPPLHALVKRGLGGNIAGYTVYGNYAQESPPSRLISEVAKRKIDVAVAWGPLAGYYSARQTVPLIVRPVSPEIDLPYLPMVYDISLGVRRGEEEFLMTLEQAMDHRRTDIQQILTEYNVPLPASMALRNGAVGGPQ